MITLGGVITCALTVVGVKATLNDIGNNLLEQRTSSFAGNVVRSAMIAVRDEKHSGRPLTCQGPPLCWWGWDEDAVRVLPHQRWLAPVGP